MNLSKYLLFFALILLCPDSYGQYFKKLNMKDGLSNPSVLAIYQDTLGRMWFGTNEGVNVYDGKQIRKYKSYDVIDNQLPEKEFINGSVNQIVGDSHGDIFMRNNGGLIKYDIRKERFKEYPFEINALNVIRGEVWCTARDSLFRYNAQTDSLQLLQKLNIPTVLCMAEMKDEIWLGTAKGLYVMKEDQIKRVLPDIEIFKLFPSSRNELWIASRMEGLYRIGQDGVLRKEINSPSHVVSKQIRSFVEDDMQNIWFGTFEGLQRYNPHNDTYSVYLPDFHSGSLSHKSVFSLCKDRQGTIWVGTYYGGINYFNQTKDVFQYYTYNHANNKCLDFPIVGQMVEDKDHDLWVCTDGGGLNRLNRKSGTFTYYTATDKNSILHDNVKTIAYDEKRDHLYVGTYTGGISRYDKQNNSFYNYLTEHERTGYGPGKIIFYSLVKDDWLYVAARNGFWRMNLNTGKFQLINKQKHYLTFEIDSHGYIWLAASFSLYRMPIDKWDQIERVQLGTSSNRKTRITKILETSDNTIYVSTLGNGVFSYSYDDKKWDHYTTKENNLLSDFCYNLVETPLNNILITNDEGISIYSPIEKNVYSIELGLRGGISAVADGCGVYVADDELIYVGGVDGMISFREDDLYVESENTEEFYFSDLYINNAKVCPEDESGILMQALPFTNHLDLSFKQNNLAIDFFNSNYVELEKNIRYQYKLDGFDEEWISTNQMRVGYTNLAPGDYVLRVRELGNKHNAEKYNEIALNITIHRPWFTTIWAFLLYFIVVASIVYGFWRVRVARKALAVSLAKEKDEKERIEEVNRMKLRFFTNISHEFRTPLTLIIGQIDILLQLEKLSPSICKRLQRVHRNAMSLRYLITELLDFRKHEQGFMKLKVDCLDIVEFVEDIYRSFAELARKRRITYMFEHAEEKMDIWFDPVQMQKVVFNLLSNAFKYTPDGKEIKVSIRKQQRMVEIAVQDTGCGIPQDALLKIFERFYQVDESSPEGLLGSGIGLALTKGIVEAHKGEIKVESALGEGSIFKIQLLMGNNHFAQDELEHEKVVLPALPDWKEMIANEEALSDRNPASIEVLENKRDEEDGESGGKPCILVVEDDGEVLDMLENIFSLSYKVYKATNGQMGFEMAQQLHPDIVVSDVMMPVMSGKEMCYKIKNCLELAYIPVVLLTAQSSVDYEIEGYMFGADDYVTKPFDIKLLLARCANLLKNRQQRLKSLNRLETTGSQDIRVLNILDQKLLDNAVEIIRRNFDNPDFDMNVLAAKLGMGRSKMFSRLKEVVGLTPNEFTLKLKLEEALRMLQEEPQYNVSEISYKLGFASPRYFSRCFKSFYGVSPQNYRREPTKE
ncbi:two-component regulator propeller domain-containing protein [Bacteroides sp.]|uniref:two-component regulator propeller domain-containing protein n=1 Tax=Bacteroides sp. TaxID=29523 RepID=UPI0025BC760C|nr:two-component regulator propeller domain-containing protein [Bacteroides sp.]